MQEATNPIPCIAQTVGASSTQELEAGGPEVLGHPQRRSKFEANMTRSLKNKIKEIIITH